MNAIQFDVCGDWQIRVSGVGETGSEICEVRLAVPRSDLVSVVSEPCVPMPVFNPDVGGWSKGYRLSGVRTQETSTKGSLVPESLELRAGSAIDSVRLQEGTDFRVDADWGTVGWATTEMAQANRPVFASYTYGQARIDSILIDIDKQIVIRKGKPHVTVPSPPALMDGETRLANVWLPPRLAVLTQENLFPVLETCYPALPEVEPCPAAQRIPKTFAKLLDGTPLTILAWGDSVTDGSFLEDPSKQRWQEQFVARLRNAFPKAQVTLVTEAWGGRNTQSYRNEPPGSVHNYKEKVLAVAPDLIVSEFVNDAWLTAEQTHECYGVILEEFRSIGAEWIILTPHYVLPDWMGLQRQRDIDDDPRGYVKGLRIFADANQVALADASLRWGRLWRQGIPYMTLMLNAINHPNPAGMKLFADSLMELF